MQKFTVSNGDEVIESLTKQFERAGIKNGALVSIVGAIDSCEIHTMNADDARENFFHHIEQPVEVNGTGEINDGVPHLHVTAALSDGRALAGHLESGIVKTWFLNVYVEPLD